MVVWDELLHQAGQLLLHELAVVNENVALLEVDNEAVLTLVDDKGGCEVFELGRLGGSHLGDSSRGAPGVDSLVGEGQVLGR